ncbi:MAG: hypothetical protein IJP14_06160 [Clostridia bacterium]|nr:hypothetical protein [Clostridia bacterium]
MNHIQIADTTLCMQDNAYSFKEKLEIARQLENLHVDIIELPAIAAGKADILLVRTISTFVKDGIVSVAAGLTADSIQDAVSALQNAAHPRVRIELPLSPVGMEYTAHRKPAAMIDWIRTAVTTAAEQCADVEFCAVDATRTDIAYLKEALSEAVVAGAKSVSICDSTGEMLPDDFAAFVAEATDGITVPVAVRCDNQNGLAAAQAILAVRRGVSCVKTDVQGVTVPLAVFATMVKNCGNTYGFESRIRYTQMNRIMKQISWVADKSSSTAVAPAFGGEDVGIHLDAKDDKDAVIAAAMKLGYDLSEEDQNKVYEEFCRVAEKKTVGAKELDALIASVALQVPATYTLENYVINTGSVLAASAQITLQSEGKILQGISTGDGPIDAAFRTIEQIIGRHFEVDDFQIQSVTEGRGAVGNTLIKLRSGGKVYSGNGISTDIIGASIRAYLSAVNKIVYEEA